MAVCIVLLEEKVQNCHLHAAQGGESKVDLVALHVRQSVDLLMYFTIIHPQTEPCLHSWIMSKLST